MLKFALTLLLSITLTVSIAAQTTVILRDGVHERHEFEDFGLAILAETDAPSVRVLLGLSDVATSGSFDDLVDSINNNQVPESSVTQHQGSLTIDGSQVDGGNLTVESLVITEDTNPVFNIQNPGGAWTDFEIKAMDSENELQYYYHSPDPDKSFIGGQIWTVAPRVWYTDSSAAGAEIRRWQRQNATQSIAEQLTTPANGYVGGWVVMVRGLEKTRAAQRALSWSILFFAGNTAETDSEGRQIWRPVTTDQFEPDGYDPMAN